MEAEIELFLGSDAEAGNERHGYGSRTFVLKGVGALERRAAARPGRVL
jgi:hypothetical protein